MSEIYCRYVMSCVSDYLRIAIKFKYFLDDIFNGQCFWHVANINVRVLCYIKFSLCTYGVRLSYSIKNKDVGWFSIVIQEQYIVNNTVCSKRTCIYNTCIIRNTYYSTHKNRFYWRNIIVYYDQLLTTFNFMIWLLLTIKIKIITYYYFSSHMPKVLSYINDKLRD